LEPRRANKRRTRVFTEAFSEESAAQADELTAVAEALEKECFTYVDLT
jgi:hypothetical protein